MESMTIVSGTHPLTSNYVNIGSSWNVSDNVNWNVTWTCQQCGAAISSGQAHICPNVSYQFPHTTPHRCPVCEGKGRVLFDPDNPHQRFSSVQDWPCRPCGASGIIWGW